MTNSPRPPCRAWLLDTPTLVFASSYPTICPATLQNTTLLVHTYRQRTAYRSSCISTIVCPNAAHVAWLMTWQEESSVAYFFFLLALERTVRHEGHSAKGAQRVLGRVCARVYSSHQPQRQIAHCCACCSLLRRASQHHKIAPTPLLGAGACT